MVAPPSSGGAQDTFALPSPAVTTTPYGAPGAVWATAAVPESSAGRAARTSTTPRRTHVEPHMSASHHAAPPAPRPRRARSLAQRWWLLAKVACRALRQGPGQGTPAVAGGPHRPALHTLLEPVPDLRPSDAGEEPAAEPRGLLRLRVESNCQRDGWNAHGQRLVGEEPQDGVRDPLQHRASLLVAAQHVEEVPLVGQERLEVGRAAPLLSLEHLLFQRDPRLLVLPEVPGHMGGGVEATPRVVAVAPLLVTESPEVAQPCAVQLVAAPLLHVRDERTRDVRADPQECERWRRLRFRAAGDSAGDDLEGDEGLAQYALLEPELLGVGGERAADLGGELLDDLHAGEDRRDPIDDAALPAVRLRVQVLHGRVDGFDCVLVEQRDRVPDTSEFPGQIPVRPAVVDPV